MFSYNITLKKVLRVFVVGSAVRFSQPDNSLLLILCFFETVPRKVFGFAKPLRINRHVC